MTNNNDVSLSTIGSGFDYLTTGTQPSEKGVAPAQKNTLRLYDAPGDPKNIGRGEIIINDFSQQGHNHPEGAFSQHANGFSWSDLMTGQPNEMFPPTTTTAYSTPVASGNGISFPWASAFGTFFFGLGSGANVSLLKQTSATDPTPAAVTFSPGADICSLTRTVTNGAERLAVGMVGTATKLLSDAAGTVAATMHTDTNSMWGMIVSGINGTDAGVPVQLIYSGTTIKTKATNADQTTALVATNPATTVNAGGFAIGALKAGGRAQRAFWGIPQTTTTAGALKFSAEVMLDIMSTDMTGADLLPVKLLYLPFGIRGAVPYRDGIVAWDDTHIVYWDGEHEYDLNIFKRRPSPNLTPNEINPDFKRRIRSVAVEGPSIYCLWQTFYSPASLPGTVYLEYYNYETGSWHNAGATYTLTTTGAAVDIVLNGAMGMPLSAQTRRAYFRSATDAVYVTHYIPRPAESTLWQNSQGTASSSTGIPQYQTGSLFGTRWRLDEFFPSAIKGTTSIERLPKVITEAEFNGNLDFGGTNTWTFQVQVQGRGIDGTTVLTAYNQTFSQGKVSADYVKHNPPRLRANIQDVQLFLTATASGAVRTIPQLLPFTIRFAYSKDGTPITELPEDNIRR